MLNGKLFDLRWDEDDVPNWFAKWRFPTIVLKKARLQSR